MPDPLELLTAMGIAVLIAAAVTSPVLLFSRFPLQPPHVACLSLGSALGTGLAIAVGCWLLQKKPRWSLAEDQDRLLTLLVPLAVGVECLAAFRKLPAWLAWGLRVLLAASAAPILLYQSRYLSDLAGPDTREWTSQQMVQVLGGLAVLLAVVWALLVLLVRRSPGVAVPLALSMTCVATAMTIMLSGYLSGGELGLPLAAAIVGGAVITAVSSSTPNLAAPIGVGVVGLFGLLVIGRFFGSLTTEHALLLFAAPLLCWLPELPLVRRLAPTLRASLQVALVVLPIAFVLQGAKKQFDEDNQPTAGSPGEPTVQDYMNFGK